MIVPILTVDGVKNWHGSDYSAIVLAGDYSDGTTNVSAVKVYNKISANQGKVLFAEPAELALARTLLENMILCVFKSSKDTFLPEFHEKLKEKYYSKLNLKEPEKAYPKHIERDVPVPTPTSYHQNNYRVSHNPKCVLHHSRHCRLQRHRSPFDQMMGLHRDRYLNRA